MKGKVVNKTDGEPLWGAGVFISSKDLSLLGGGAATDRAGFYEITGIPAGLYSMTVSLVGFESFDTTGIEISTGGSVTIDVELIHLPVIMEPVSVTVSRRPEKILEAPASVNIIQSDEIEARTTLTPAAHIKGMPAVDIASTGLNQSNAVMRGFNNVFSGAMLFLVDNRIARIPSLRYNAYNFISTVNEDIERIELVSGPGSALYGPNSASGIMHIITKSSLKYKRTSFSIGGGERNLFLGSFLHSDNFNNRVGYKISGQYYRGDDWKSFDTHYEPDSIRLFRPTPYGPEYESEIRKNTRDFEIEKISGEARIDYLVKSDLSVAANGGVNRSSGIEITSLGSAQAVDWTYYFGQFRLNWKNLFAQVYLNASDAGDSYLLRTGQLIVDKSRFWSGQVQHNFRAADRINFIYGFDSFFTRPNTEYTLNGRNEDKDNVNEYGIYLQTEFKLSRKLKFIEAARLDLHNRLDGLIFSPRSAVTYQPDNDNNFRLTYNRAYSTPYNTNFCLDILQAEDPFGIGNALEPFVGFNPGIDVRVQGVPENGFHWSVNSNGPRFRSSFAPLDPRGIGESDFIDFNDPVFTNVMWNTGRDLIIAGFADLLTQLELPPGTIDSLINSIQAVAPDTVSGVNNALMTFNPNTSSFEPTGVDQITDINPLEPSYTNTLEFGYKGKFSDRFKIALDLYYTNRNNFISPLVIETPNVFLDQATLEDYLAGEFGSALADSANIEHSAILELLDQPQYGGNGNGSPVDELTNIFSYGAARIPFGTVTPVEAYDPEDVLVTFRNFGNVSLYGLDFSISFDLNQNWSLGGNYSYLSKNIFKKSENLIHDILLNTPRNKAAVFLQYNNERIGFGSFTQVKYVDAFDMYGPFLGTRVNSFIILDQNFLISISKNTRLTLTVQNILDNRHIEFVGAPELGRLAILRITHSF
ncbi:MAG: TonB-dependent receptor [Candidatus Zixiibacteriota bacterium]|nr:MAG: TonB-dependent receptor [candidate division Zixibacteria bacterium]